MTSPRICNPPLRATGGQSVAQNGILFLQMASGSQMTLPGRFLSCIRYPGSPIRTCAQITLCLETQLFSKTLPKQSYSAHTRGETSWLPSASPPVAQHTGKGPRPDAFLRTRRSPPADPRTSYRSRTTYPGWTNRWEGGSRDGPANRWEEVTAHGGWSRSDAYWWPYKGRKY